MFQARNLNISTTIVSFSQDLLKSHFGWTFAVTHLALTIFNRVCAYNLLDTDDLLIYFTY